MGGGAVSVWISKPNTQSSCDSSSVLIFIFISTPRFILISILFQKVEDLSDGCGMKFSCVIVSSKFEGKPLLQRHRQVILCSQKCIIQTLIM